MNTEVWYTSIKQIQTRGDLNLGVFRGILGGGAPPGSPSQDPISDQNMSFFIPVFRPVL